MKKWIVHPPTVALAGLLFQIFPPVFIFFIADAAFARGWWLSEGAERTVSLMFLTLAGCVSLGLGGFGTFLCLSRLNGWRAALWVAVGSFPALVGGVTYFYALLIFLAWV
jgi:hypothetical protein